MPDNPHGKTLAIWSFPEFVKYERGTGWYFWAMACGVGLFLYAIFTGNFLFALIVVMVALVMFLDHSKKQPASLRFAITEDGLEMANDFIPWKDITKFWIIYEPPEVKRLYVQTKRISLGRLSIPLEKENPVKIREVLLKYLPEDLTKESEATSDALRRILKL